MPGKRDWREELEKTGLASNSDAQGVEGSVTRVPDV
jgi:hypothetical protein